MRGIVFALLAVLISCGGRTGGRTVRVAQSEPADVVGPDNVALQKAAALLRPGDTLLIGPGTYEMINSLFVPSGVTVRGTPGKTILRKSAGVNSPLAEDGDYGESVLMAVQPENFRPGMGITISDDVQNFGWDVSVTTVTAVEGRMLHIQPMTLRDYEIEHAHARVRNTFPILSVEDAVDVVLEDLIVDGN